MLARTAIQKSAFFLAAFLSLNNASACKGGKATISGHNLYPPLTWERQGKLTGVSVEVVSSLLKNVEISANIGSPAPWKRLVHRAKLGDIDILMGVRKNTEWEEFLHYIEPPLTPSAQGVFYLSEDAFEYTDWNSLKGFLGGTLRGASFGEEFDTFARDNLKLQETNTLDLNFLKLKKKRIKYFLAPLVPTQLYLLEADLQDTITNTKLPLLLIDEYIAISKVSDCDKHAAYFSQQLQEITSEGTMDDILEKYFLIWFEDIEAKTETFQYK